MKNWEFHLGVLESEDVEEEVQVQLIMVFDQTIPMMALPEAAHTAAQDLLTAIESGDFIRGAASKIAAAIIALDIPAGDLN